MFLLFYRLPILGQKIGDVFRRFKIFLICHFFVYKYLLLFLFLFYIINKKNNIFSTFLFGGKFSLEKKTKTVKKYTAEPEEKINIYISRNIIRKI